MRVSLFFLQAICIFFLSQMVLYHFIDKIFFRRTEALAWRCSVKWCLNSNLGGLFRGSFWDGTGAGGKITPCLKLVKIMLETWNFVLKFVHICSLAKMVLLIKAIVWELCKGFFSSVFSFCKIKGCC